MVGLVQFLAGCSFELMELNEFSSISEESGKLPQLKLNLCFCFKSVADLVADFLFL